MKKIPRAANGPVQFGCQRNFFELNYFQIMALFSYQNSTIPLVFKVWHSFLKFVIRFSRLTFVFFPIQHLLFQLWGSFHSFEHLFFNFDIRFIQINIHFLNRHLYFKFDIRFINSSSRFSNLTFVFQVQRTFVLSTLVLLSSEPTVNYGRLTPA